MSLVAAVTRQVLGTAAVSAPREGHPGGSWTSWEHFALVQPFSLKSSLIPCSHWSDLAGQPREVTKAE